MGGVWRVFCTGRSTRYLGGPATTVNQWYRARNQPIDRTNQRQTGRKVAEAARTQPGSCSNFEGGRKAWDKCQRVNCSVRKDGRDPGILPSTQGRPHRLQADLERATYYRRVATTQPTQGSPF